MLEALPPLRHDPVSLTDRQKGSSSYVYLFHVCACVHMRMRVHLYMPVHECMQRAGVNLRCQPQELSTLFLRLGLSLGPGTHLLGEMVCLSVCLSGILPSVPPQHWDYKGHTTVLSLS